MSKCVSQYAVALVRAGSSEVTCTWQSMKPGMTVAVDESMTSAPGGDWNPDCTDRILSSRTVMET